MTATFRPSQVWIPKSGVPLAGAFSRIGGEHAAAILVLASVDAGDEWKPITVAELQATLEHHFHLRSWMSSGIFRPDLGDLCARGYALVSTDDAGRKCYAFTELGFEQLARWVRTTIDDDGADA